MQYEPRSVAFAGRRRDKPHLDGSNLKVDCFTVELAHVEVFFNVTKA
jgi:hypothetical protein